MEQVVADAGRGGQPVCHHLSVVIPTAGRECVAACVAAVRSQADRVVVVSHRADVKVGQSVTVPYDEESPNISRMWNLGIDAAATDYVAVLNDDVIVPPWWGERIVSAMQATGAAIGYVSPHVRRPQVVREPGPTGERMTGYAWVLDRRTRLRLDESLCWWYSDNDIEWQARLTRGVVVVPGSVRHLYPNVSTVGALRVQADADRERFREKWGMLP